MSNGYVVAEGDIQGVRSEMEYHPMQISIPLRQTVGHRGARV